MPSSSFTRVKDRCLGEPPERTDQPEVVEDRLVLLSRVRPPIGRQPVMPPRCSQLGELRDRDDGASLASGEPPIDMAFRPEEQHRASRVADVVPPLRGRHEDVEHGAGVIGATVADADVERIAAVRAVDGAAQSWLRRA